MSELGLGYETRRRRVSAARLLLDLRLRPDRAAARRGGLRRGDAGRRRPDEHHRRRGWPAVPARRRDRRHRVGHVRRAGHARRAVRARRAPAAASASTSACSIASRRCSPTRPASTSRPATTPARMGNRHPTIVPYETFPAADGEFVLAVGNDDQWRRFCRVARRAGSRRRSSASRPIRDASRTTTSCARTRRPPAQLDAPRPGSRR